MEDNNKTNVQELLEFTKATQRIERATISKQMPEIYNLIAEARCGAYQCVIKGLEDILSQWK